MSKQLVDERILVDESNLNDVNLNYRQTQKICFYCTNCGKLYNGMVGKGRKNLLCHSCNTKRVSLERWGTTCSLHNVDIEKKVKDTMIKKYGVEYPAQNEKVRDKMKKTTKERYGVEHYSSSEDYIKKVHNTCMERYGVIHHSQLESEKQKKIETCMKNNGVDVIFRNYRDGPQSFVVNGIRFDSKWEKKYYDYLVRENIDFTFHPNKYFLYSYAGKNHKYYPDFLVEGKYVEIKGDQFFNEDGSARNPYNDNDTLKTQAKFKCMKENGVILLRGDDLKALGII